MFRPPAISLWWTSTRHGSSRPVQFFLPPESHRSHCNHVQPPILANRFLPRPSVGTRCPRQSHHSAASPRGHSAILHVCFAVEAPLPSASQFELVFRRCVRPACCSTCGCISRDPNKRNQPGYAEYLSVQVYTHTHARLYSYMYISVRIHWLPLGPPEDRPHHGTEA